MEHIQVEDIRTLFSKFGDVNNVFHNKVNMAVLMNDEAAADAAIKEYHGAEYFNCVLNVRMDPRSTLDKSKNKTGNQNAPRGTHHGTKLTVFNIEPGTTEDDVTDHFSQFGKILNTFVSQNADARKKHNAYIQVDPMAAENIVEKTDRTRFKGSEIYVAHSRLRKKKGQESGSGDNATIFVNKVPYGTKENVLKMRFASFGQVYKCSVQTMNSQMTAEIVMDSADAYEAEKIMSFTPFYGKKIEISVSPGESGSGFNRDYHSLHTNMGNKNTSFAYMQTFQPPNFQAHMAQKRQMSQMQANSMMMNPMAQMAVGQPVLSPVDTDISSTMAGGYKNAGSAEFDSESDMLLCPTSQGQVDNLIKQREILEKVHPYEESLINEYPDGSQDMPPSVPPASYFHLLRDRAIIKVKLARAAESGYNVYGGDMVKTVSLEEKYGFGKRARH